MAVINVLNHQTIDKIAAGEVVERPLSVVKELVENAIDAGADAVTVEIKDGGISLIRVTDNGSGIEKTQIKNVFLRHATSKITSAEDLTSLVTLGFRGEALASIAAVSMVELITKTPKELTGIRYVVEGGIEKEEEEIGAPDGTTVLVRSLFYNTPPRRKFLKQPQTEGSYVADLMEHLAMSNPGIAFKFIMNGQTRFYTTGNHNLHEIIYRIYGKEIAAQLIPFHYRENGVAMDGLLGKPVINRANRSYEIFYVNGRYIKSTLISKAIEEGYRTYLMQHKFPFCVLHFQIDTDRIDVNVHPTKMEIRIADEPLFYDTVKTAICQALHETEMIPEVTLDEKGQRKDKKEPVRPSVPEPFERRRIADVQTKTAAPGSQPFAACDRVQEQAAYHVTKIAAKEDRVLQTTHTAAQTETAPAAQTTPSAAVQTEKPVQMELFEDKILSAQARAHYEMIGQLFDTYWLISYENKLLIVDQHAAHEKVMYERLMKRFKEHDIVSQTLAPPIIVTMSEREKECYQRHADDFTALGFVIGEFGGNEYAIRGVPLDLYGYGEKEFFHEILDELIAEHVTGTPDGIRTRIATMACKAAVKGNMQMSRQEAEQLIDELLTLENPYHCPHGRPTVISMSKYEIEKKFKRIVTS